MLPRESMFARNLGESVIDGLSMWPDLTDDNGSCCGNCFMYHDPCDVQSIADGPCNLWLDWRTNDETD